MSLYEKLKITDWPMTFAFLSGSTFLIMAISFGGTLYNWYSGVMITFWTLFGLFLVFNILLLRFHPGVSRENQLWPARFIKIPVAMYMQLQVFLAGGIILVQKPIPTEDEKKLMQDRPLHTTSHCTFSSSAYVLPHSYT